MDGDIQSYTKEGDSMSFKMSRKQYADLYGPTTGDSIRLRIHNYSHMLIEMPLYMVMKLSLVEENQLGMVWDKIHNLQENRGCGCCYYECNYY